MDSNESSSGIPTWSGAGTPIGDAKTSAEVIKSAGLDWRVATEPAYALNDGVPEQIPGHRAVVRSSDRMKLGIVRDRFTPVQNADAFASMDRVINETGASYEAAGAVDGGRGIWILAKVPGEIVVGKDDVTAKYVLLSNAHDGTAALRVVWTPIRVVCQNSLRLGLAEAVGDGVSIRHTAAVLQKLDAARDAFSRAGRYFAEFETMAQTMAAMPFRDAQMVAVAAALFPSHADNPSPRAIAIRERLVELFEFGMGHAAIRGTAWAALNAVAELTDQHRSFKDRNGVPAAERRFHSTLFGSGHELKQRAFELIVAKGESNAASAPAYA